VSIPVLQGVEADGMLHSRYPQLEVGHANTCMSSASPAVRLNLATPRSGQQKSITVCRKKLEHTSSAGTTSSENWCASTSVSLAGMGLSDVPFRSMALLLLLLLLLLAGLCQDTTFLLTSPHKVHCLMKTAVLLQPWQP